ncbi:MAG: hypothetical protein RMZ41_008410 [Nostoc sp. DedVER02]|uniref:hypothetical protein n=1 Tax=unclassified Nostoc TaxID=2593658 RepID=UPI002AD2681F|nr:MULTISPECIES: hypothetical protein [unclassified Nostoc]MDZ7990326.1 hypothetical protein [Nostoc sp. DedVER02]MDZ8115982.1 hypothetical protein [Nostoc sp. DedVER01b]
MAHILSKLQATKADLGIESFILSGYPHLEEAYRVAELPAFLTSFRRLMEQRGRGERTWYLNSPLHKRRLFAPSEVHCIIRGCKVSQKYRLDKANTLPYQSAIALDLEATVINDNALFWSG